jgi:cytochrome c553
LSCTPLVSQYDTKLKGCFVCHGRKRSRKERPPKLDPKVEEDLIAGNQRLRTWNTVNDTISDILNGFSALIFNHENIAVTFEV